MLSMHLYLTYMKKIFCALYSPIIFLRRRRILETNSSWEEGFGRHINENKACVACKRCMLVWYLFQASHMRDPYKIEESCLNGFRHDGEKGTAMCERPARNARVATRRSAAALRGPVEGRGRLGGSGPRRGWRHGCRHSMRAHGCALIEPRPTSRSAQRTTRVGVVFFCPRFV
jgi:hypothetical protein